MIGPSLRRGSDAVSPTAHYTGHVWVRNGLSHPELATWEGRVLFDALRPAVTASRALGGPTLEGLLLARHRVIDDLLARAIESGSVQQVVEPACGMSPRGWRFTQRYGDGLTYIEADLPQMAARKRRALARMGSLSDRHRVAELDLLRDDGPASVASLAAGLDRDRGVVIITEGLITYFDQGQVLGMWDRFARVFEPFPQRRYLADLRLAGENRGPAERAFGVVLSAFVRGRVHTHFADADEATAALRAAGFSEARLHRCGEHPAAGPTRGDPGARRVHIIEAVGQSVCHP
ncbi:MAG TPA: class I SAM-dependent methyltransferase [Solirubrobacterales bacterium]|nr:class I SAM-dependent methyltransferase [Solirubrobacterales bacterium]